MKLFTLLALFTVSFAVSFAARADVDLDKDFFSKAHQSPLFKNQTKLAELPTFNSTIDTTNGFPEVRNQHPLGACQSFAMAAWLDYIFFFKTGQVVDLSEKAISYNLISFLADEFWDASAKKYPEEYLGKVPFFSVKPNLGSGIAPFMIESFLKTQVIPNAEYSYGDLYATNGAFHLDIDLYKKYFDSDEKVYTRAEYLTALDQAFLTPPPSRFIYKMQDTDFSTGKAQTIELRSPKDFADKIGLTRENVITYFNSEYSSVFQSISKEDALGLATNFDSVARHFQQRSSITDKSHLKEIIKKSLDRRMAVMYAGEVWKGDWTTGIVYEGGGGHAMVIVGYQEREGKTFFKLRNSWGKDKLIDGYNFVESDTLTAEALYIVVHEI